MICSILLLFTLSFRVSGKCLHHKKDLRCQAEENSNITLEWQLSSRAHISFPSLKIHCVLTTNLRVFFHLDNTSEEPPHEQFAGRVQCDTDALAAGLVRLHVLRVRTNDSGPYICRMVTEFGRSVKAFSLNITAAGHVTKSPQTTSKPASRERVCLIAVLGLVAAAASVLVARCLSMVTKGPSTSCTEATY